MGDSTSYYKPVDIGLEIAGKDIIVNEDALKKRSFFHYIVKGNSIYDIVFGDFSNIIRNRLDVYVYMGYNIVFKHGDKKVLIIYNKVQP